jgi:valyl-tRNA synthetase
MAGFLDAAAERDRLEKQLADSQAQLVRLRSQLDNQGFRDRAPAQVVADVEQKHVTARERIEGIKRSLAELGAH